MGSINEPSVYPLLPNCLIGQVFIHPVTRSILGVGFRSVYLSASVYISVSVIYFILVLSVILQSYLSLTSTCPSLKNQSVVCLSVIQYYLSVSVILSFNIIYLCLSIYISVSVIYILFPYTYQQANPTKSYSMLSFFIKINNWHFLCLFLLS